MSSYFHEECSFTGIYFFTFFWEDRYQFVLSELMVFFIFHEHFQTFPTKLYHLPIED